MGDRDSSLNEAVDGSFTTYYSTKYEDHDEEFHFEEDEVEFEFFLNALLGTLFRVSTAMRIVVGTFWCKMLLCRY